MANGRGRAGTLGGGKESGMASYTGDEIFQMAMEMEETGEVLYEAMAAGVDIVHRLPYNDQKFMVVFSDGADLNRDIKSSIVEAMAIGINNFEAYCVDYMPRPRMHPVLKSFAETHNGRIWKN